MPFSGRCRYGLIIVCIFNGIAAYHFDTDNLILYKDEGGPRGSYFGYSVDLWNPGNSSSVKSSIIIGAPRGNSSFNETLIEPGTVFRCEIGERCEEWKLNLDENHKGSWLGASLAVKNSTELQAVVCAPTYANGKIAVSHIPEMKGMCYRVTTDKTSRLSRESFYPLAGQRTQVDSLSYAHIGESGFSIHLIPGRTDMRYVLGCPGMYLGQGTMIIPKEDNEMFIPNLTKIQFAEFGSYSGYAVTSGNYFTNDKSSRTYVAGAPRGGDKLYGLVVVTSLTKGETDIDRKYIKSVDQIGEYFGAALASCDIDGDGRDELLVGAPHWTNISDEGRIYVYKGLNRGNKKFKLLQHLEGTKSKGRYGSAITCLGDVDYDGYEDVAVGAPYGGNGNGAVYVYHGSKRGLRLTQKIFAPNNTRGFGISISKAIDIDNNGYADFAVGAYLSGHVTLIRSKRIVRLNVTLSSNLTREVLTTKRNDKSFAITACSSFTGKYPPQQLNVTREIKIDEMYRRAYVYISGVRKYEFSDPLALDKSTLCQTFEVHVNEPTERFPPPIKVSVTQRLFVRNEKGTMVVIRNGTRSGSRDHYDSSSAVTTETCHDERIIYFAPNCGSGTHCISNLSIYMNATNLKNVSHYVIGSEPFIEVDITVNNSGDPAYLTAHVLMPNFIKLDMSNGPRGCGSSKMGNQTLVKCPIANPLNEKSTKTITLRLDMSSMPSNTTEIPLVAKTSTQSNETDTVHYETRLRINCVAETDIGIGGETNVDFYSYTLARKDAPLPSVRVQHTYEIKNYELTPIAEVELSVSIPTHWVHRGKEIEVVRLNESITTLGGKEFDCVDREENDNTVSSIFDAYATTEWLIDNNSNSESKFKVIDGKVFGASPDNRTLFINCTSPAFKCKTIDCKLGPLNSAQSMARLVLAFDLLLQNFTPEMIGDRNIIFFVTNGSTSITNESGINQTINNKPDSILIGTRLIGSPSEYRKPAPAWILPLAVGIGLLLYILIIIGLFKFGFFKRNKKMKLDLLKEEHENENMTPKILLDTTSAEE